jgi:hypothetical protein
MKPGDTIELNDTRLEVIEAAAGMVRLRYTFTPCVAMKEWFSVAYLIEEGWRVIPAVEVPPCMDV